MSVTAILVDDEKKAVSNLQNLLKEYTNVEVCGFAHSANAAREILKTTQADILFLDINMPTETGFDLLASIDDKQFEVIFVTAHDDYALKALRVNAVDYLLKPVDIDELKDAVKRAEQKIEEKKKSAPVKNNQLDLLADMIGKLKQEQEIEKISLSYLGGFKLVEVDDIMYIEGDGNYCTIFLKNMDKIVVTKQIGTYEDVLPLSKFCRIHKSTIINLKYVTGYNNSEGNVAILQDGNKLSISRRKLEIFLSMIHVKK
jgi:two-component system, LytTR family, response regulator